MLSPDNQPAVLVRQYLLPRTRQARPPCSRWLWARSSHDGNTFRCFSDAYAPLLRHQPLFVLRYIRRQFTTKFNQVFSFSLFVHRYFHPLLPSTWTLSSLSRLQQLSLQTSAPRSFPLTRIVIPTALSALSSESENSPNL